MGLIKRQELDKYIRETGTGKHGRVYLFFGERYLCRDAADRVQEALLQSASSVVHPVDGEREDAGQTLARLMSYSLLPGIQIYRVSDSRLFHSKAVASTIWDKAVQAYELKKNRAALRHLRNMLNLASFVSESGGYFTEIGGGQWQKLFGFTRPDGDISWADKLLAEHGPGSAQGAADIDGQYIEAFKKGLPDNNILIFTAENVDKRKKLFTYLKKNGEVVDCSVASGSSKAAKNDQQQVLRELVLKTLAEFGKKMAPATINMLFERVGFHPVAVVMETEKLALFVGDADTITSADLETMVGRTREDALFELTEAFGKKQTARVMVILKRLLENGIHPLAVLATFRNYLRKILLFRSMQLQPDPQWRRGMSANQFQQGYLPALKEQESSNDLLKGHPYALYMSFVKAEQFSCTVLKKWLSLLLEAEYRLKGSPIPAHLVLEELLLTMLSSGRPQG